MQHPRRIRRYSCTLLTFWCAFLCCTVDGPRCHGSGDSKASLAYFTLLGDQFLARTPLVVHGKVKSVQRILGGELVEIQVLEALKGKPPEPLTLLANPRDFFAGTEQVLFLKPFQGGPRHVYLNRFGLDSSFPAKLSCLRRHLRIEQLAEIGARQRAVKSLLLEQAAATDHWTTMNVVHEVRYLLDAYPQFLSDSDQDNLRLIAGSSKDAVFHRSLLEVLDRSRGGGRPSAAKQTPFDPSPQ